MMFKYNNHLQKSMFTYFTKLLYIHKYTEKETVLI